MYEGKGITTTTAWKENLPTRVGVDPTASCFFHSRPFWGRTTKIQSAHLFVRYLFQYLVEGRKSREMHVPYTVISIRASIEGGTLNEMGTKRGKIFDFRYTPSRILLYRLPIPLDPVMYLNFHATPNQLPLRYLV